MSRAAYAYFAGAIAITAATVWGVHYIQKAEGEVRNMLMKPRCHLLA